MVWTATALALPDTRQPPEASGRDAAVSTAEEVNTCGLSPELHRRLNALLDAADLVDYRGTLLIEFGNDREFIAVDSAQSRGRGSLLRLNHQINGRPRDVLIRPVGKAAVCDLYPFYGFSIESGQAVAGRSTYRLTIRPKDTLRLGYVMDVDLESNIPLRVVTATPDGQVLERFEFATIDFSEVSAESRSKPRHQVAPGHTFAALPPGFEVVGYGQQPVDFLVVSDGLAAASVFIESQPPMLADGEGVVLRGGTLAFTRGTPNDYLITVMGEVPVTTARLLADAVRQGPISNTSE